MSIFPFSTLRCVLSIVFHAFFFIAKANLLDGEKIITQVIIWQNFCSSVENIFARRNKRKTGIQRFEESGIENWKREAREKCGKFFKILIVHRFNIIQKAVR